MTIQEALALYNLYGTLCVVDGDSYTVTAYDDDEDEANGHQIVTLSI